MRMEFRIRGRIGNSAGVDDRVRRATMQGQVMTLGRRRGVCSRELTLLGVYPPRPFRDTLKEQKD
jgi:hypothetical protein